MAENIKKHLHARYERLVDFIRDQHGDGECEMATKEEACTCPLCDLNAIMKRAQRPRPVVVRRRRKRRNPPKRPPQIVTNLVGQMATVKVSHPPGEDGKRELREHRVEIALVHALPPHLAGAELSVVDDGIRVGVVLEDGTMLGNVRLHELTVMRPSPSGLRMMLAEVSLLSDVQKVFDVVDRVIDSEWGDGKCEPCGPGEAYKAMAAFQAKWMPKEPAGD